MGNLKAAGDCRGAGYSAGRTAAGGLFTAFSV